MLLTINLNYCILSVRLNHWRNELKNTVIKLFYLISIPVVTALTQENLPVKKLREPGDSLDISIRQELEHAAHNGTLWIKRQQKKDNCFGDTETQRCTALAILALSGDESIENTAIISNAVNWLALNLRKQETTNITTAAWSCAALTVGQSINRDKWPQCATSTFLRRNYDETNEDTALLCSEILLSTDPAADKLNLKIKQVNEANINHSKISLLKMWLNSRSINSRGGQLLTKKGNRIDWRGIYAEKLIGRQKIDPKGGGYWAGKTSAETICNTALSILISKEL